MVPYITRAERQDVSSLGLHEAASRLTSVAGILFRYIAITSYELFPIMVTSFGGVT